ncbi:unnamed protein product [Rhizophagus irregularis]|nr:unnamed protein product [Rhizophagus irregularis]
MERRSRKGDMDFVLRFAPPTREPFAERRLFPSRQINIHEEIIIHGGLYEIGESNESNEELLNQLKISNQLIGNIAVIGESSKHFDVLISDILDLIKNILELYETIQFNKKICDCLIDRIESTEMSIKSLKRHKEENVGYFLQQNIYYGYHKFIDLLERIRHFITDISQLHGLRKFKSVEKLKEHFRNITREFDDLVINLRLKVTYSKKDQGVRDDEAAEYDGAALTKFLENVDGGITTSNKKINPIFDEIIIKRSQISDSKKVKFQTKKITKLDTKNYDSNNTLNNNNNRGGNIHKMSYESKFVACKYYDSEQSPRFDNELAMLQLLNNSDNIIRFLGLSDLDEGQVLIFDWAEYGDLQSLYEKYTLDWPVKLNIALGICRGLSFLHGCQILHREIRCQNIMINERLEPKVANFNFGRPAKYSRYFVENITAVVHWLAPEKLRQGTKVKFSSKCDIFSFGMLLWEIAFDVIPYRDWSYTNIIDHVKAGKRESIDFGPNPSEVQKDFAKIIRAAWQDDPTLRPGLHELFNQLYDLTQKYPLKEFTPPTRKNVMTDLDKKPSSSNLDNNNNNNIIIDGDNDDPIPEVTDYKIDFLPMIQPILLIEEGIKLHKSGERKPAWECFQSHAKLAAENGNATAQFNLGRMYYAGMVGLNRDKEKGLQYLKMAALKNQPRAIQFLNSVKIDRYI